MDKKRIFLAISFEEKFKQEINRVLLNIKPQLKEIRFTSENYWHLTILPPQYLDDFELNRMIELVKNLKLEKFKLQTNRIAFAPFNSNYRMIWLVFDKNQKFISLKEEIIEILGKEFKLERIIEREEIIHLTLARFKFFNKNWSEILPIKLVQEVEINKIEFWKSTLKRTGAEYEVLETIKF